MTTGRDQAQILRQLINDRFTPQTGVGVSLQLVPADALLPLCWPTPDRIFPWA